MALAAAVPPDWPPIQVYLMITVILSIVGWCGLARVVRAGHKLLGLATFFTVGPKEVRAWTIPAGATAQESAGVIHTDFARGFIAAETIGYDDYISLGGEQAAKDAGKMRAEGRSYKVKDGDVLLFRFNV